MTPRLAALIGALALAACSAQQTTRTGFLEGGALPLSADAADPDALSFAAPPARLAGYRTARIAPVEFRPGAAAPAQPDPAVLDDLRAAYAAALAEALQAQGYRIEPEEAGPPAPGTLRIRAAITGFERANVPLNVMTSLIIAPVTAGGAASEAEVVDAITGERLAALATHSNATPFLGGPHNYYAEHGHARAALARHARALAARLSAAPAELAAR